MGYSWLFIEIMHLINYGMVTKIIEVKISLDYSNCNSTKYTCEFDTFDFLSMMTAEMLPVKLVYFIT